jgi:hypothetical protein
LFLDLPLSNTSRSVCDLKPAQHEDACRLRNVLVSYVNLNQQTSFQSSCNREWFNFTDHAFLL